MFFSYIAFWSSCRVTPDLGEVHARRAEFGHVFPEGRNLEGGMLRRRNPGRNPPEDRIEVWVFKKRRNPHFPSFKIFEGVNLNAREGRTVEHNNLTSAGTDARAVLLSR